MLQRSCREIDERLDFFVATGDEIFSSPGNIWRAPYSPQGIFSLLPRASLALAWPCL